MARATFVKTSWETWVVAANFEDDLVDGETIVLATSTITAVDDSGNDVSSAVLNPAYKAVNGSLLQIRVINGTEALSVYTVLFRAITNQDNRYSLKIDMKIKN